MENVKRIVYAIVYILVFGGFTVYNWEVCKNDLASIPFFWVIVIQIFLIQVAAYIPAAIFQSQQFYDLTGSLTNLFATATATFFNPSITPTQILAALMVAIWAFRLGGYLFTRILKQKSDKRFDQIKIKPINFFFTWLLQGLWIALTISPLLVVMTQYPNQVNNTLIPFEYVGGIIWIVGWIAQVIADCQKNSFRNDQNNKHRFITTGLWKYSRHPNYAGEITLWFGAALFAIPSLTNQQFASMISPIFVYFLLSCVSGVPMLQQKSDQKWSQDPAYQQYKRKTPVLFPWGKLCECNSQQIVPSEQGKILT